MPITVCNYVKNVAAGGKFVALAFRDAREGSIVVFSDFSRDSQHRHIVSRWEKGRGATLPASGMRVAGGGWWKLEEGILILYGQSVDYGPFDREWLRERLRPGMVFHETDVEIR